ncbi:hypothetical protein KNN17_20080 [Arthrobacter bambusae]|uniref:hypothetical protein n=1 Tax=Arthrobacter bambusae TaxID=1338426 RepID=UPI001F506585|nr:hypothetical protein [Arthrobacter bambusae]MCI0143867.1 hypothetical protein [Arthrobacter bambusae]
MAAVVVDEELDHCFRNMKGEHAATRATYTNVDQLSFGEVSDNRRLTSWTPRRDTIAVHPSSPTRKRNPPRFSPGKKVLSAMDVNEKYSVESSVERTTPT